MKLLAALFLALGLLAQTPPPSSPPSFQAVAFVLSADDSVFAGMPVKPKFSQRIYVFLLPQEGQKEYRVEFIPEPGGGEVWGSQLVVESAPAQTPDSEWQFFPFSVPNDYKLKDVKISVVAVIDTKSATLKR